VTLSGEISGWQLQTTKSIENGDSKTIACVTPDRYSTQPRRRRRAARSRALKLLDGHVNLARFGHLIALTRSASTAAYLDSKRMNP
jgi:hypothetical protein